MQSTLLGLAVAIIVALVAALVGPLFIDWSRYRTAFEAEATRLSGVPVKIEGAIDARLLPTPSVTLRGVAVPRPDGGAPLLQAQTVAMELGLGPLLRGRFQATDVKLAGAVFELGFDRAGQIDLPLLPGGPAAEQLSIDKFSVTDSRAVLADAASGGRLTLDRFSFAGDVRSLFGPVRGDGSFAVDGKNYTYRVAASRADEGGYRFKLGVEPAARAASIDVDGLVTAENGRPHFDGMLTLLRPVGPTGANPWDSEPWRLTAKVRARPASALLENVEFQFGPEDRALKLSATAEFTFGARPHLDGVASARQLDLDRASTAPGAVRRVPIAAMRAIGDLVASGVRPPMPVQFGIAADNVVFGGASLQGVRGDLAFDGRAWTLDRVELRAPGYAQVRLGGRIAPSLRGTTFVGLVEVDANDPRSLMAWLEGRSDVAGGPIQPMKARGEVTIGSATFAVERLKAEFDRDALEGRLVYHGRVGDQPTRLEAELRAADLDLDALMAFGQAATAGTTLERPREIKLALDLGQARIGGMKVRRVDTKLRLDAAALQIDQLSVADLGGTGFEAKGRVDLGGRVPRGTLNVDLNAQTLAGVTTLAETFAPSAVAALRRFAPRLAPVRLQAAATFEPAADAADVPAAKLVLTGTLGTARIDLTAASIGTAEQWRTARLRLDGTIAADDGVSLLRLVGADGLFKTGPGGARLTAKATGTLGDKLDIDAQVSATGLEGGAKGMLAPLRDPFGGDLRLNIALADLSPLRPPGAKTVALPLTLAADLNADGARLTLTNLAARLADTAVNGRLVLTRGERLAVEGHLDSERLDLPALLTIAAGMPQQPDAAPGGQLWSAERFAATPFADIDGVVTLKLAQALLGPGLDIAEARARVRLARGDAAIEDVTGRLAGGQFQGALKLSSDASGTMARANLKLRDADAALLLPRDRQPAIVAGRLTAQFELEGSGMSPRALAGAIAGTGTLALADLRLSGIDAGVFATAAAESDAGAALDPARLRTLVETAFANGTLSVGHVEATLTAVSGVVRLAAPTAPVGEAQMALGGQLDLSSGEVDTRLTLTGPTGQYPSLAGRPDVLVDLKGRLGEAKPSLDIAPFAAWLTLRAVEHQARQLEALEANRRAPLLEQPIRGPAAPRDYLDGAASEANRSAPPAKPVEPNALDRLRPQAPRSAAPKPSVEQATASTTARKPRLEQPPTLPPPGGAKRTPPIEQVPRRDLAPAGPH